MQLNIPEWILWIFGGGLSLIILLLAIFGAFVLWQFRDFKINF